LITNQFREQPPSSPAAAKCLQYSIREGVLSIPDSEAKKKWIKENTVYIGLKLMKNTDADIIAALDPKKPKQAQIKDWIRKALKSE